MREKHVFDQTIILKYVDAEDIDAVQTVIDTMPIYAELLYADIFVECIADENTAVIAAEAFPASRGLIHNKEMVGNRISDKDRPGTFRTFRYGVTSRNTYSLPDSPLIIHQASAPIMSADKTHPAAVLTIERAEDNLMRNERPLTDMLDDLSKYDFTTEHPFQDHQGECKEPQDIDPEKHCYITAREMEHRVRNNLQMIVSLLSIQSSRISDPEISAMFTDNIAMIAAIAKESGQTEHDRAKHKQDRQEV